MPLGNHDTMKPIIISPSRDGDKSCVCCLALDTSDQNLSSGFGRGGGDMPIVNFALLGEASK